jgi:hypothetical protein
MERDIELSWEEASEVLAALDMAIDAANRAGAFSQQLELEDAFAILRDKMFPTMPDA